MEATLAEDGGDRPPPDDLNPFIEVMHDTSSVLQAASFASAAVLPPRDRGR